MSEQLDQLDRNERQAWPAEPVCNAATKSYEEKYGARFEDAPCHVKQMWKDAWQSALASREGKSERKCSECGDGSKGLSLYCVACLNNDGWYLADVDPAHPQSAVPEWNPEEMAKRIAREIFSIGDEENSPVTRIQYMGGKWPDNEKPQGGMVESAIERVVLKVLTTHKERPTKESSQPPKDAFRQVGWTNEAQISYMADADGGGSVYPDKEDDCTIPVFVPGAGWSMIETDILQWIAAPWVAHKERTE